ncbi:MAG: methyltransferase [Polyangiaceae bacterium]|nr:methyltransferase [Polyangiaceae bacterium]
MPLPDVTRLASLDDLTLTRLRERLVAIGLTAARVEPIVRRIGAIHPILRRPILQHHLRAEREPFAAAARALMFSDAVPRAELDPALGELLAPLLDAGLLAEGEGGLSSGFCLTIIDTLYVLTDDLSHGGEAVMGLGPVTTALAAFSAPRRRISKALDLGCGAGTIALVVARNCDHVIGTDINARAITVSRFNARLNGITNVELREGSLFEPVKGERFDLIASQPPFIPQSDAGKSGDFMRGGSRGDELPLALLGDVQEHLAPEGRAVLAIEWGSGPGLPTPAERVKGALGSATVDVVLLSAPPISTDAHAVEYAAALHPTLGPAYEREARDRRAHCASLGLEVMIPTFCVARRVDGRRPRFDALSTQPLSRVTPTSRRIDKLLEARDKTRTMATLIPATLRLVEGVIIREEQVGTGAGSETKLTAVMPPKALVEPVELTPLLLRLITCVHAAKNVSDAVDAYLAQFGDADRPEALLAKLAHAVLAGLLEVAD